MGFFSKLFGLDKEPEYKAEVNNPVYTTETKNDIYKTGASKNIVIDMSKHADNLDKVLIDMSKGSNKIDMSKHVARVGLAMDYSGSMRTLFDNGSVQRTINRLLPIALRFDDNGELESWIFSERSLQLSPVTVKNFEDYVKKVMRNSSMSMGGTNYSPVLRDMVYYYKDVEPSSIPAYIIFITDGENWDEQQTDDVVRELSKYNIFVQFVGIGDERFEYLKKLDDLPGREKDNTGFTAVRDMDKMSDTELYNELLRQYVDWLNKK